jgi:hypothetical protein
LRLCKGPRSLIGANDLHKRVQMQVDRVCQRREPALGAARESLRCQLALRRARSRIVADGSACTLLPSDFPFERLFFIV